MAERVDHAALSLAIGHVLASGHRVGAARPGSFECRVNIIDSKHDLVRRASYGLIVLKLAHYYLATLAIDTKLHAMGLADTDVFDQPKDPDVPRNRFLDIGYSQHWDHPRPRR